MLSYHATAPEEEVDNLAALEVPATETCNLASMALDSQQLTSDDLCTGVLRMFIDTGFVQDSAISHERLCRWVLSVRRNYREVTYHNWIHAFNVTQCMFAMMIQGNLSR